MKAQRVHRGQIITAPRQPHARRRYSEKRGVTWYRPFSPYTILIMLMIYIIAMSYLLASAPNVQPYPTPTIPAWHYPTVTIANDTAAHTNR